MARAQSTSGKEARASRSRAPEALRDYARKRNFGLTHGPPAATRRRCENAAEGGQFVVQKHHARRLHYDFRLELEGSLKSWAVPKGPSLDPKIKRLAVHVEDHPLDYAAFEGTIPAGEYGAGEVIVWDRGRWQPSEGDAGAAFRQGKLKFRLFGEKLSGGWTLVRTDLPGNGDKEQWLLIKEDDAAARPAAEYDVTVAAPGSVLYASGAGKAKEESPSKPNKSQARLDRATAASLPGRLSPQLATLVDAAPVGDWRYEVKFDGYRLLARIAERKVRLYTRSGQDWRAKLPQIATALQALGLESAWLDGEIVVLDAQGVPDFQALQNAFEERRGETIIYYLFDLMYHDGLDLRSAPLEQRRALLKTLLARSADDCLRYSDDITAKGEDILQSACALKLEGLIGKRAGSPYVSRRSVDWVKLKCRQRQEFVIGGHTSPQGSRSGFGALLVGVHDGEDGPLRYAGRVGTGFSVDSLESLHAKMQKLARRESPFVDPPTGSDARGVTWLAPRLVCEIEFAAWTRERRIRHAAFRGLREDKPARAIVSDTAASAETVQRTDKSPPKTRDKADGKPEGMAITHAERVIDAQSGTTKFALAKFYLDIAKHLLPQLAGRPLALVRLPTGIDGEQFFQRHAGTLSIAGIRTHGEGEEQLIEIATPAALIGAVQMGCIEFHTRNARFADLERPDRIVLDLDPDPKLPWARVVEATHLVLALLDELGLSAFLKTSGGKGMHVVIPLARRHGWEQVKAFSKAITQHLARHLPQRFSERMGAQNRVGKIFVDYLRNQKGGTTVAAYSVRARPGLGVSVPIARDELDQIAGSAAWTVLNLADRLKSLRGDPWADYAHAQGITAAMLARLDVDRASNT